MSWEYLIRAKKYRALSSRWQWFIEKYFSSFPKDKEWWRLVDYILAPKAQERTATALSNGDWGERPHLVNHWIFTNPLFTFILFKSVPVSNSEYALSAYHMKQSGPERQCGKVGKSNGPEFKQTWVQVCPTPPCPCFPLAAWPCHGQDAC